MRLLPLPARAEGAGVAALVIRLVVGPILAYHGYRKIDGGVSKFADGVKMLDIPLPEVVARLVVVMELVGGICLVLGLLTRIWSLLLAVQFIAIPFVVKSDVGLIAAEGQGPGFELDLLIAACVVSLAVMGPGAAALDRLLGLEGPGAGTPARPGAGTRARPDAGARARPTA